MVQTIILLSQAANSSKNQRDALIFNMRFGLIDCAPKTLNEIGQTFGITRERIRQLVVRAIRKLKGRMSSYVNGKTCTPEIFLLADHLHRSLQPGQADFAARLVSFCATELSHLPAAQAQDLIGFLLTQNPNEYKFVIQEAKKLTETERRRSRKTTKTTNRQNAIEKRIESLLAMVTWPTTDEFNHESAKPRIAARKINFSHGTAGVFESSKCCRGVQFESTLEKNILQDLEFSTQVKWYLEQPLYIDIERQRPRTLQYKHFVIARLLSSDSRKAAAWFFRQGLRQLMTGLESICKSVVILSSF